MGLQHSTTVLFGDNTQYAEYFTDAAFQSCTFPSPSENAQAELTARFITHTTRLFENSGPTPSSSPYLQGQLPPQSSTTVVETPEPTPTPAAESPSPATEPGSSPEQDPYPEPATSSTPAPGTDSVDTRMETPSPARTGTAGNPTTSRESGDGMATVKGTSQPTIELSNDSEIARLEWHHLWLSVVCCIVVSMMV